MLGNTGTSTGSSIKGWKKSASSGRTPPFALKFRGVIEHAREQRMLRDAALENKFRKMPNPMSPRNVKLVHNLSSKELTKYPMQDLAIETIELLLQSKYDETENRLGHAQIIQLLKLCLRTYFTFDWTIYEQVKGTSMGSQISGFIAEAVLQRLESLVFQRHKQKFWARDEDQDYTCPYCDGTFTPHIVLVGHLRIHRTDTGEPVREAPTYTHRTRLHCPQCPRTFSHRMGLFGQMRIHESGLDRIPYTPTTSNTSTVHTLTLVSSVKATTTTTASSVADTDTADFSCPHCPRTFTSRIDLVGHLRIHRTETGKPVPGAPTYTHQARLNCPHCPRTFRYRMGLFGHMRIHDDLR
nr:unnamed protein product [Spirometra erinaceieuropaei]